MGICVYRAGEIMKRMNRLRWRKHCLRRNILLLCGAGILVILCVFIGFRPGVIPSVRVEAGEKLEESQFLRNGNRKCRFLTDIQALDTSAPGNYSIRIQIGEKIHTSQLKVMDTVAPKVTVRDQWALLGETLDPKSFIEKIHDATATSVQFKGTPDTSRPGEQDVTLVVEDRGKNRAERRATLTVLDVQGKVTREAGTSLDVTIDNFLPGDTDYEAFLVSDLSAVNTGKPGLYSVQLNIDGKVLTGNIEIVDTTPPTADAAAGTVWLGDQPEAKTFVKNIRDVTGVTARFKEDYDFTEEGKKKAVVVLTDTSGNESEVPVSIRVRKDTEPPVISGAYDRQVAMGETISYKKNIEVTDNRDTDLTFEVDNSKVNLKQEGTWPVIYSAQDAAGNRASRKITVTVKQAAVSQEQVNELCDSILAKITKETMPKKEKAHAIYEWSRGNISYTGDSDKSDWLAEACRGMTRKQGDCFTYFSVSKAMLTRVGIENMDITRVGGKTRHYWSLISCGDGWYHFDSCPNKDHKETFMMTDQEVEKFTRLRGNHYYTYDKTRYPRTPAK